MPTIHELRQRAARRGTKRKEPTLAEIRSALLAKSRKVVVFGGKKRKRAQQGQQQHRRPRRPRLPRCCQIPSRRSCRSRRPPSPCRHQQHQTTAAGMKPRKKAKTAKTARTPTKCKYGPKLDGKCPRKCSYGPKKRVYQGPRKGKCALVKPGAWKTMVRKSPGSWWGNRFIPAQGNQRRRRRVIIPGSSD